MQTHRTALLNVGLAILLAACSRTPTLFADTPAGRPISVVVVEADALIIDGRHVRLANAAAPQLAPQAHCWAEAVAGQEVRETVLSLVMAARDVSATPTGGADEDNRAFSRVTVDGVDLGQALLDEGLAVTPSQARFDWCGSLSTDVAHGPRLAAPIGAGG